jgi:hypothetical protein
MEYGDQRRIARLEQRERVRTMTSMDVHHQDNARRAIFLDEF